MRRESGFNRDSNPGNRASAFTHIPVLRDIRTSCPKRPSYDARMLLSLIYEVSKSTTEPVLRFLEAGLLDLVVYRLEGLQKRCHFVEWPGVRSIT